MGIQLQVNLSSNDAKVTPAVRLLAAAVRPLAWERQDGAVINRRLYLPEYRLDGHDPSFGREMDLSLVVASLMNRWGEDILPEEVAYTMFDGATNGVHNAAYAVAAAACCGYPAWQGWLDLKELRAQIHDGCSVGVEMETRLRARRSPSGSGWPCGALATMRTSWPTTYCSTTPPPPEGPVARTMPVADFQRFFTGRAIILRPKPRGIPTTRPLRFRCGLEDAGEGEWFFTRKGARDPLPEDFGGWIACTLYDGVAHATTAHKTFRRMERTAAGGIRFPAGMVRTGDRCCVYAVDQTGRMRVAEILLPHPAGTAGAE